MDKKTDYDAIIIGAGVGGLICGCYLAKAGLKTLIIEKHWIPGGYCTSFARKDHNFDVGVHYIGGIKKGSLSKIIKELELGSDFKFHQSDPSDKIILSKSLTYIRANPHDTILEFIKSFPNEKNNIEDFFSFIMQTNVASIYRKIIGLSFKDLLDKFFTDEMLKSSIGVLLLGNLGLPPSRIASIVGVIFLKDFILDPGYYPEGGMQGFANYLVNKFKAFKGNIILSSEVSKIIIENNVAQGVLLSSGKIIYSNYVVSCSDVTLTFNRLIKQKTREQELTNKLIPSNSLFVVYLGMNTNLNNLTKEKCNIWYFPNDDIENCYKLISKRLHKGIIPGAMIAFPYKKSCVNSSKSVVEIITMATYEDTNFWANNREILKDSALNLVEKVIPDINKHIDLEFTATPNTFEKYTLNRNGAAFGWASSMDQTNALLISHKSSIKNLFIAGHWRTRGAGQSGISTVAVSGRRAALGILENNNIIIK